MISLKIKLFKLLIKTIIPLLFLASCSDSKVKVIPTKDFEDILYDLYLADGLLADPGIRLPFSKNDSIDNYINIVEEHGYSIGELENTLRYLYLKNPDKLVKLYDRVLLRFSELESKLNSVQYDILSSVKGSWRGKDYFLLSSGPSGNTGEFIQDILNRGRYIISFDAMVSPADETYQPSFIGWIVNADSAETGKKYYLPRVNYIKDGHWHKYRIPVIVESYKPVFLKGNFYYHNEGDSTCYIDAMIWNIRLDATGVL